MVDQYIAEHLVSCQLASQLMYIHLYLYYMSSGCLVCDEDASPTRDEDVDDEEWFGVWQNGFYSIDRLNVRNVQQNSGELLAPLRRTFR